MIPEIKLPNAILFDWDNTLVDSWVTIHEALRITFKTLKLEPWTLEQTKIRVHHSLRNYFPELFGNDWPTAMQIYLQTFEKLHLQNLNTLPGSEELLKALQGKNIYLAIVSNKTGHYLRAEIEHLGWQNYFSSAVGSGDAIRDKPAKEALLMALSGSQISPDKSVWIVGDSISDMQIAHNAGCFPVLIRSKAPTSGEFGNTPPACYVPNCSQLIVHINGL